MEAPSELPLDGYDQLEVLRHNVPSNRTFVIHNVPVGSVKQGQSTSTCLVPPSMGNCSFFGITGGAIRVGDWKLLTTGISTPTGMRQIPVPDFEPTQNTSVPEPYNGTYFLFNITDDPTETNNVAGSRPEILEQMIAFYDNYSLTAVPDLSWTYGFPDPARFPHRRSDNTWGPFVNSSYCKFEPRNDQP